MKVAYITDDIYLEHDTGMAHPESKQRLIAINKAVEPLRHKLVEKSPVWVSNDLLQTVHSAEHIQNIIDASEYGTSIDSDTICSPDSYSAAVKAVGAGIVALDGIKNEEFQRAFCAVRPPGHHATPIQAMGFCLFNNIAISAKYAQSIGYEKVMIIDLPPFVKHFDPDIILVSAGYDLHESDPLAQLNVTTEGIRQIVRTILDSADVPTVFFLEGGYDVDALGENVKVTLDEMLI